MMKGLQGLSDLVSRHIRKRQRRIRRERAYRQLFSEVLEDRRLLAAQPLDKGADKPGVVPAPVLGPREPVEREKPAPVDTRDLTRDSSTIWKRAAEGVFGNRTGEKDGPLEKIGTELARLFFEFDEHKQRVPEKAGSPVEFAPTNRLLKIEDEKVVVDVISVIEPERLVESLKKAGMDVAGIQRPVVSGFVPISRLDEIADLTGVRSVRPFFVQAAAGAATTQGDPAQLTDNLRSTHNLEGINVTVGVLSDSYNVLGGAAADVLSGDLPGTDNPAYPAPVNVLSDATSGSDEGRAMLQVIHDVAPGARLAFATAGLGQAAFAQSISDLREIAAADIIVDDVLYFAEPFFQDGLLAQAVDTAHAAGVAYFAAAGNNGDNSYETDYRVGTPYAAGYFSSATGAPPFAGGIAHDFDPDTVTDDFQNFTLDDGSSVTLSLQWDQPFASVTGNEGASTDLDIYLLNSSNQVVAASLDHNIGNDAVEILQFTNTTGSSQNYSLLIVNFSGPDPNRLKYIEFANGGTGMTNVEFDTGSSTIFGHANAAGAAAVGSAFWNDTPEYGTSPPLVEPVSSIGGTAIYLDPVGGVLESPVDRQKPDFTAPSGGNNTFFGSDVSSDADTLPNFGGTSSSAAHAAGLAALLLEAVPTATPRQLYDVIGETAIDMGTTGHDALTGAGLVDAESARTQLLSDEVGVSAALDAVTINGSSTHSQNTQGGSFTGDTIVQVDTTKSYTLSATARSGDGQGGQYIPTNRQYLGLAQYDSDGNQIDAHHIQKVSGSTDTVLTQDLVQGQSTEIHLANASGWFDGSVAHARSIAWYPYTNSSGYTYPDYTYTRHTELDDVWAVGDVDEANDKITLNGTWSGPTLLAGTKVRNTKRNANTLYTTLFYDIVLDQWGQYTGTISGVEQDGNYDPTKFWPGTVSVQPVLYPNIANGNGNLFTITNIEFDYASPEAYQAEDAIDLRTNQLEYPAGSQSYNWTQISGPEVTITNPTTSTASVVAPNQAHDYTLGFQVDITDGGNTETERVIVVVGDVGYAGGPAGAALASLDAVTINGSDSHSQNTQGGSFVGDTITPVDTSRSYTLSATARSGDDQGGQYIPTNRQYLGLAQYDSDGNQIDAHHIQKVSGSTDTVLTQDLVQGQSTEIHLGNASGWYDGSVAHQRSIAWYPYTNSSGYTYPDYTYTRHTALDDLWAVGDVDEANDKITLNGTWSGPTLLAGTKVRNTKRNANTIYTTLFYDIVPNQWTRYTATISGVEQNGNYDPTKFWPGTVSVQPILYPNSSNGNGNLFTIKDIELDYKEPEPFHAGDAIDLHAGSLAVSGGSLTYNWTQTFGPPVTITNPSQSTASITAPDQLADHTLRFELAVSDGTTTETQTVSVDVTPAADYTAEVGEARALLDAVTIGGSDSHSQNIQGGSFVGDTVTPVDTSGSYTLSATARSGDDQGGQYIPTNRQYLGLIQYDSDGNQIDAHHIQKVAGSTDTVLTQDLVQGQSTEIHLANASGWYDGSVAHQRSIAWYPYTNSSSYTYPDYTYTRHTELDDVWAVGDVDEANDKIMLNGTWSGPTLLAGTKVRNTKRNANTIYTTLFYDIVPDQWTQYTGTISGVEQNGNYDPTKFWPGTVAVQPILYPNSSNGNGNLFTIKDIEFDYLQPQDYDIGDKVDLHVNSIDFGGELNYGWVQKVGPEVLHTGSSTSTFVVPDLATDKLVFEAVVDDGSLQIVDEVVVNVDPSPADVDVRLGRATFLL